MGRLRTMDPIEAAGELFDRAREVTQMAVGEARRFAASDQGRRIRHNVRKPCIRFRRTMASWIEWSSACPI